MLEVGLTGGIASGKSFVGRILASLGCVVIEADKVGHEVMAQGGAAYAGVVERFGAGILTADGAIDRKRLAAEVFGSPERLALLNSLVHPSVFAREAELMAACGPESIVVVEAAILVETGRHKNFDKLIVAACPRQQQIERALERDGATLDDILKRLARQMPLKEKTALADYVIDTSGTKAETERQTKQVFYELEIAVKSKI